MKPPRRAAPLPPPRPSAYAARATPPPESRREHWSGRLAGAVLALLFVAGLWRGWQVPSDPGAQAAAAGSFSGTVASADPATGTPLPVMLPDWAIATELRLEPAAERSALADALNQPHGTLAQDLAIVRSLLDAFVSVQRAVPEGDNPEITAALAGENPAGVAFLPPEHPARDAAGRLVDRWGTPFFFHALSAQVMEVRSAGPDRRLWTADDGVETPASPPSPE